MTINDTIKLVAGTFILLSVSLGYFVNEFWYFMTVFVGLNLFQSSFTNWCLLESILKKSGMKN